MAHFVPLNIITPLYCISNARVPIYYVCQNEHMEKFWVV